MYLFAQPEPPVNVMNLIIIGGIIAVIIIILFILFIFARFFRWWMQSWMTGAGIGILDLLGMTFRKVNPDVIVRSKIMAVQAGIDESQGVTSKALEAHYLAGGNVPLVIRSLIASAKAKLDLDFKLAAAIDLAGRNILEAVQTSVNPKVIDCPSRGLGKESLDGVAQNGIQLKVKARVTVRELAAVDRRGHRGDHRRPGGRGYCQRHRHGQNPFRSPGLARQDFQNRARPPARFANRL